MLNDEPCVKTPKGIEEIEKRGGGLQQKERRVLILVDGARDVSAITAMFPQEDVTGILNKLVDEGYISQRGQSSPKPAVAPPGDEAQRFDMAKNFMINTTNHFLGPMGSSLIGRLRPCGNLAELRALYGDWRAAIGADGGGRKQLPDLESRLAALLS